MIKKIYTNVNVVKLHTELNRKGILPFPVLILKNGDGEFNFEDGTDMALVQQIIDNHELTPIVEPISDLDKVKMAQAEQFEYILEILGGM